MIVRLTAEFWVHAYLNRLRMVEIPAFVVAKGDLTAGAVVIKLNKMKNKIGDCSGSCCPFDMKIGMSKSLGATRSV